MFSSARFSSRIIMSTMSPDQCAIALTMPTSRSPTFRKAGARCSIGGLKMDERRKLERLSGSTARDEVADGGGCEQTVSCHVFVLKGLLMSPFEMRGGCGQVPTVGCVWACSESVARRSSVASAFSRNFRRSCAVREDMKKKRYSLSVLSSGL